jgi:dihydropteroate synthase
MLPFNWGPLLKGGPLFIGILNLTPDSFSDGGRFLAPEAALAQARALVAAGAGMLDLGAESTRPGAAPVSAATEWDRLEPVLAALRDQLPATPLSLDTRHAEVAARGLSAGVAVLNDVTGFSDPGMLALACGSACGLIAMRSRREGTGFHMPPYDDPVPRDTEVAIRELRAVRDRLQATGISETRVLLDPGFGFGTTFLEDAALWEALPRLPEALAWPVQRFCLGVSRKRFLAARAGTPNLPPDQRDGLTAAAHTEARRWDYRVFRTHAIG